MPSARHAQSAAARSGPSPARQAGQAEPRRQPRARPAPRPRRVPLRSSVVRVRWERVGRIALLVVLAAVVVIYGEHALSYVSTREQASHARAAYVQLAREHRSLEQQAHALRQPATIVQHARGLGMTRTGEQPYVLPGAGAP